MEQYNFQYCPKIIIFSKDKSKVLLCKRKGENDYDGTFGFPGGKMETTDNSIIEGLAREKNEELSPSFKIKILKTFTNNILFKKKNGKSMILPYYLAIHENGEVKINEEYSEYKWVQIKDLEEFGPRMPNIPEVTEKMKKLLTISKEHDFEII